LNLYQKVKADNKRILNNGFVMPGILNNNNVPGSQSQTINVFFNDVSFGLNPETGLPIVGRKVSVSLHLDDITIYQTDSNYEGWVLTFTNNQGQSVKGVFINPMPDRTLGMLTTSLRIQE